MPHTDPTPGYLADVCRALADAEASCRRAPFDHRNNPPVSNGHEDARIRDAAVRNNAENAP